jgi:hypothetical protein
MDTSTGDTVPARAFRVNGGGRVVDVEVDVHVDVDLDVDASFPGKWCQSPKMVPASVIQ